MVAVLLDAGANPNLHERLGEPFPLMAATHTDGEKVLQLLIHAGATADIPNFYLTTPLHQAAKVGQTYLEINETKSNTDTKSFKNYFKKTQ